MSVDRTGGSSIKVENGSKPSHNRADSGFGLALRRLAAWLVDYVVCAGFVSIFYIFANVFYLEESTREQGNLMLLCAVLTVLLISVYVPWKSGASIGQHLLRLKVVRWDQRPRSLVQLFAQECVLKIACGPFVAAFFVLDYVVFGLIMHRDSDHEPTLDYFLKIHVVPN